MMQEYRDLLENFFVKNEKITDEAKIQELADALSLPPGIHVHYEGEQPTYYQQVFNNEISYDERMEYLSLLQTKHITTIKNTMLFFFALAVISLVGGLILLLLL